MCTPRRLTTKGIHRSNYTSLYSNVHYTLYTLAYINVHYIHSSIHSNVQYAHSSVHSSVHYVYYIHSSIHASVHYVHSNVHRKLAYLTKHLQIWLEELVDTGKSDVRNKVAGLLDELLRRKGISHERYITIKEDNNIL